VCERKGFFFMRATYTKEKKNWVFFWVPQPWRVVVSRVSEDYRCVCINP
jgi:hypothetical protein